MYTYPLIAMHFLTFFKCVVNAFSWKWDQEAKETTSAGVVRKILGNLNHLTSNYYSYYYGMSCRGEAGHQVWIASQHCENVSLNVMLSTSVWTFGFTNVL